MKALQRWRHKIKFVKYSPEAGRVMRARCKCGSWYVSTNYETYLSAAAETFILTAFEEHLDDVGA
jgi:hypothetical protein